MIFLRNEPIFECPPSVSVHGAKGKGAMPRVSVIIPTYNRKDYVQEAIDSVLAQTFTDYEIIVVDDGSTDGTGEVLQAKYGDRIRYVWQENQGESVARNRGIEMAQGEYIALLDSDDLWLPEKLEKQVAYLEAHPDVGMVFSQAWQIDAEGNRISDRKMNHGVTPESLTLQALCFSNCIAVPSTAVLTASLLQTVGGFDPAIRYGEVYDLFLRVRLHAAISIVPEPLACFRRHAANQSSLSPEKNAHRLAAHLATLKKVFNLWTDAPAGLQRRATAWHYAESALQEAAIGNDTGVKSCLEQMTSHDPSLLRNGKRLSTGIADYAASLYQSGEQSDISTSLAFVRMLFDGLPQGGFRRRSFMRRTLAATYVSLGFTAYQQGDMRVLRYCFSRALALRPALVANGGILSLLFEAVFGKKAAVLARRAFKGTCRQ